MSINPSSSARSRGHRDEGISDGGGGPADRLPVAAARRLGGRGAHNKVGGGGGGLGARTQDRRPRRAVEIVKVRRRGRQRQRQRHRSVRPASAVDRGRGGGAEPAEPQVRHVQRLDGPAAAQARDQRVLAHRGAAVVAAAPAAAASGSGRRGVLPTATGQLVPALASAAAADQREDVQEDHLLRDAAGRGARARRLPAAAVAVAVAVAGLSVRSVRLRPEPVLGRFPTVGPEQVEYTVIV